MQSQPPGPGVTEWIGRNCFIMVSGQGLQSFQAYPYQVRLWEDESRQRIILKSRQMGISRALACEALYRAIERPGSTILFVSRSLQAARNLLRYARQSIAPTLRRDKDFRPTSQNSTSMEWEDRDSRIVSLAASVDAARSYSATDVYLDEAAYLPWAEEIYQSLAPTVSSGGRMTVVSTPHGRAGLFHRLWEDAALHSSWSCHRIHWPERPEYTPEWAAAERQRHTGRSWAEEYDLSFEASGQNVFAEEQIRALLTADLASTPMPPYFAGLDLARYSDFTVLLVLDSGGTVVAMERFNIATWSIQVDRVVRALRNWKGCRVLCDATGAGDAVFGLLQARAAAESPPLFSCVPFIYTTESRTVLMEEFVLAVEGNEIHIPTGDETIGTAALLSELRSFQWERTAGGRTTARHPSGGHDDCVQALALAWKLLKEHRTRHRPAGPALIATGQFRAPWSGWQGEREEW